MFSRFDKGRATVTIPGVVTMELGFTNLLMMDPVPPSEEEKLQQ